MRVISVESERVGDQTFSSRDEKLGVLHRIGETYLVPTYESKVVTTDMDGVIIHDDNAVMAARTVGGNEAMRLYGEYASLNIKAAPEGIPYCWYAPTVFVGQLLVGLPVAFNRTIGTHMRLIPGTERFFQTLTHDLGYNVTAVTAGHQEAAEEVSRRIDGIQQTIGTRLSVVEGVYGDTVEHFVGGFHKLAVVNQLLYKQARGYEGTHIGDSWSDVETLKGVPGSIAFNPGCLPALQNATISVIGTSKMGLLPLFDYERAYSQKVKDEELPKLVVVHDQQGVVLPDSVMVPIFEESKLMKKRTIEELVEAIQPARIMESNIKRVLAELGVVLPQHNGHLSPELFDRHARELYAQYVGRTL